MGTSSDGCICLGVMYDEDHEFLWDNYEQPVDWWREHEGYKPPFELYDSDGAWLNGIEPSTEQCREYYDHRDQWDKDNPIPFDMHNYHSDDCTMFIMAVPGTNKVALHGYPSELNSSNTFNVDIGNLERFFNFCTALNLPREPKWYLYSYWG
jgi:hypothetical protein